MSSAAAFYQPGGPEVLRVVEVPDPTAGPGEVVVRVKAAGVQPYDVAVVAGQIHRQPDPRIPTIPGNEYAGVVEQVGAAVSGFAVGDEVLGYGTLNSYQELLATRADQVTAKPAAMPWEVAGGFTAGAQTAHIAWEEIGAGAGETVLVHGAAGAVGTVAVQLARLRGATVIGTAREAQHGYVRSLGAVPIAYSEDFVQQVRALAPQGIDAAIDGVGGPALDATLELVQDRSRILTLTDHALAPTLGIRVTPLARSAERLALLADLYARGELKFPVMATYPLARAADALRAYQARNIRGKIVITIP